MTIQTFLPYADFCQSAKVLDYRRLGKQRVECLQILNTLTGTSNGWSNHPIVKAWKGHELTLRDYALCIIDEWVRRGYKDTCLEKVLSLHFDVDPSLPKWLGDERVHSAYRSLLLYKDSDWYGQWGWTEEPIEKIDYTRMLH